jgi:hypothetical protein
MLPGQRSLVVVQILAAALLAVSLLQGVTTVGS